MLGWRWIFRILLIATVGCSGIPERGPGQTVDFMAGLERRVLPNGLAIVVKEDRRLPTVTAMLAYRVDR
jgi:hypothetical protein